MDALSPRLSAGIWWMRCVNGRKNNWASLNQTQAVVPSDPRRCRAGAAHATASSSERATGPRRQKPSRGLLSYVRTVTISFGETRRTSEVWLRACLEPGDATLPDAARVLREERASCRTTRCSGRGGASAEVAVVGPAE